MLVNTVVLTSGVRADRIGPVVGEEIVVVGVVKGVVAIVFVIRAMEQRNAIVEVGSRSMLEGISACVYAHCSLCSNTVARDSDVKVCGICVWWTLKGM